VVYLTWIVISSFVTNYSPIANTGGYIIPFVWFCPPPPSLYLTPSTPSPTPSSQCGSLHYILVSPYCFFHFGAVPVSIKIRVDSLIDGYTLNRYVSLSVSKMTQNEYRTSIVLWNAWFFRRQTKKACMTCGGPMQPNFDILFEGAKIAMKNEWGCYAIQAFTFWPYPLIKSIDKLYWC